MEIRIEGLPLCLDGLKAVLLHDLAQLRVNHLDALLERLDIRLLHREGPLKIIEERQQIAEHILCNDGSEFFFFLRRAAAEVFKIRLQAQDTITLFLQLRLECGNFIRLGRGAVLLPCGCVRRIRLSHSIRSSLRLPLCHVLYFLFFLQAVHLSYHFN